MNIVGGFVSDRPTDRPPGGLARYAQGLNRPGKPAGTDFLILCPTSGSDQPWDVPFPRVYISPISEPTHGDRDAVDSGVVARKLHGRDRVALP
jgi:hypothetical protein